METVSMRKELLQYIDEADERLIKMIYAMVKAYKEDEDYEFTEEEIKEFEERREKWLQGESKAYTWEEAKEMILKRQPLK